jgi:hypothetical protein
VSSAFRRGSIVVLLALLASPARGHAAAGEASAGEAVVRTQGASLVYTGLIVADAVARARGLLEASPQVTEVVINSAGGDVEAGMDFGEAIHERALDVRVAGGLCMSSCANYVFPAGRHKTIEPGSLVLWHGSMLQEGLAGRIDFSRAREQLGRPLNWLERWQARRAVRDFVRRTGRRQDGFYGRIGVDGAITVIGQRQGCRCNWTLSIDDMALFGVADVSAPADYGMPGSAEVAYPWELVEVADPGARLQRAGGGRQP